MDWGFGERDGTSSKIERECMMSIQNGQSVNEEVIHQKLGKFPIRNLWFLFVYASDLSQFRNQFRGQVDQATSFRSLVSRLLCHIVDRRLRRGLGIRHLSHCDVLRRVRGRIDVLETYAQSLLQKGRIACRYDRLTVDIPRNRLARTALISLSSEIREVLAEQRKSDHSGGKPLLDELESLHRQCGRLEWALGRAGVSDRHLSSSELDVEQISTHEMEDWLMVSLSKAALDYSFPSSQPGIQWAPELLLQDDGYSKLFERAIGNFYRIELPRDEWIVRIQRRLQWRETEPLRGVSNYLPIMKADVVLENRRSGRKITIDTKFKSILKKRGEDSERYRFDSKDIYQLYSYIRSQEHEGNEDSKRSEGILLYPSVDQYVDAEANFHGHRIRFVTVDLNRDSSDIVEQLKRLVLVES